MKTKEELNALKEEVETVSRKLHELTDEELAQVTGGNVPCVDELTDELIKSGNFQVPSNEFEYKKEKYFFTDIFQQTMRVYTSSTGKRLFIPMENVNFE